MPSGTPWEPSQRDLQQIETMSGYGMPNKMIASIVGIHKDTLENHAKKDDSPVKSALEKGKALAAAQVTKTAYAMATSGNVPSMTMFWLKTRLGWSENPVDEDKENVRRRPLSLVQRES